MWGYTNTQMPPYICAWGGVSVNYKIRINSTFWVLYVVFCRLIIANNILYQPKSLFLLHNLSNIT